MPKKKRPPILEGKTYKIKTQCGNLFLRINRDESGDIIEIMAQMGKAGNCANAWMEGLCCVWSEAFKFDGMTKEEKQDIVKQVIGIHCPENFTWEGEKYKSCVDAMGRTILKEIDDGATRVHGKNTKA